MSTVQKDPDVALTMETVANCLSLLCKTGDGLAHAYVRFVASDRYVRSVLTCLCCIIKCITNLLFLIGRHAKPLPLAIDCSIYVLPTSWISNFEIFHI